MLLEFNFSNFGSFRKETVLLLEATAYQEHRDHLFQSAGLKLIPVAGIFGANSSGKTNVYRAFEFACQQITRTEIRDDLIFPDYFRLDEDSIHEPSTFEFFFTSMDSKSHREYIYQYGFSMLKDQIVSEWLYRHYKTSTATPVTFLKREEKGINEIQVLSEKEKGAVDILKNKIRATETVLSKAAYLGLEPFSEVYSFFTKIHYSDSTQQYKPPKKPELAEEDKASLLHFLSAFDPTIKDVVWKDGLNYYGEKQVRLFTVHETAKGRRAEFPLSKESAGTQKMFALYDHLRQVIKEGGVYFIDELNARLHPLLLKDILILFLSKETNPKGAQLIFTCHEPWLLWTKLLRRDEIYFTDREDDTGESSLYSLSDFKEDGTKIRNDEDWEKNYLLGKYGGIPSLSPFDFKNNSSE